MSSPFRLHEEEDRKARQDGRLAAGPSFGMDQVLGRVAVQMQVLDPDLDKFAPLTPVRKRVLIVNP